MYLFFCFIPCCSGIQRYFLKVLNITMSQEFKVVSIGFHVVVFSPSIKTFDVFLWHLSILDTGDALMKGNSGLYHCLYLLIEVGRAQSLKTTLLALHLLYSGWLGQSFIFCSNLLFLICELQSFQSCFYTWLPGGAPAQGIGDFGGIGGWGDTSENCKYRIHTLQHLLLCE